MRRKILFLITLLVSVNLIVIAQSWTQKSGLPVTGLVHAVGFSISQNGKGYIGTGSDGITGSRKDFWEWDQATDSWTKKADFGGMQRSEAVGFSINTNAYIGTAAVSDIWEWIQASGPGVWTYKTAISVTRGGAVAFSIGTKGYIGTGAYLTDFWEWDQPTNVWTQKTDFAGAGRTGAVGFSIGSMGYIGTGFSSSGGNVYNNDLWEYDPAANTWKKKQDIPAAGRDYAVGFSIGTKGFIGTGADKDGKPLSDFWEYDSSADTWVKRPDYGGGAVRGAAGFSIGNKGYIGTGSHNPNKSNPVNDFWEYSPVACTLTITSFSDPSSICAGNTIDIYASGGTNYAWSTGETGNLITVSPTTTTTYGVTGTNTAGCMGTADITITVKDCGTTAISEMNSSSANVLVMPNPFSESAAVIITGLEGILSHESDSYRMKVYDVLGNEVRSVNFTGQQTTIERGSLADGVYFYRIQSPLSLLSPFGGAGGGRTGGEVGEATGKFIITKL